MCKLKKNKISPPFKRKYLFFYLSNNLKQNANNTGEKTWLRIIPLGVNKISWKASIWFFP